MKKQETQKRGRARTPNNRTTTGFRIFEDLWADQDIHMHEPPTPDGVTLEPLLRWMEENAHRELSLEDIAAQAMMSTRSLSRRFREQTGTTPLQWLKRSRLRKAQCLLETSGHPIEWIAMQVGFGSSTTSRDQFKQLVGVSPQAYRRAFRGPATN